jgi:hypothetical protein
MIVRELVRIRGNRNFAAKTKGTNIVINKPIKGRVLIMSLYP